ncbi:MAG: hypothetical protein ABFR62_11930 [Bacteroidota bacterium]
MIKKLYLTITIIFIHLSAYSQNASVEQSNVGIQVGLLGTWIHFESKLTQSITFRTEFGFDFDYSNSEGSILTPSISIEPRWYYNLKTRNNRFKNIEGNSGNFFSIRTTFTPDWFVISKDESASVYPRVIIAPTWGMRRLLSKKIMSEIGFGVGYYKEYYSKYDTEQSEQGWFPNLYLRIGFNIKRTPPSGYKQYL